ncbi:MAG: hypothetical protein NWR72_00265 [Bacteroidia bacterium]|nr:hypothetical protein [Bacteroidia bacterium]
MNYSLRTLLIVGVLAEIAIFVTAYALHPSMEEAFRFAARYSGRLSAAVFLSAFYLFAASYPAPVETNTNLRNRVSLFAVLHLIHFGFLAANVYLNDIPLVPVKLTGGALAYLMIVAAPFYLHKANFKLQLTYFYYASLVMILTYVARIKGDFQGADPFWFHYVMMGIFLVSCILFGWQMFQKSRKSIAG